jgi:hypothetical protein
MSENKIDISNFKKDMGYKICSITDEILSEDSLYVKSGEEKIVFNCLNFKDEEYECHLVIDTKESVIRKSDCEKKVS